MITPLWLSGSWRSFLYSSSVYSCHLFLISYASVRSIPFLSFIVPIFAWNVPLVSLIFLKRSLVFPILLFSSISLHWSLSKAFFSWVFFGTLHSNGYIFPFLLCLLLLFYSQLICKASADNHFAFVHFFFLGMVLITASCKMSWTSIHNSSGTLSDLIPWIYLSLLLYNHKGLDLCHIWIVKWFSLLSLSLNLAMQSQKWQEWFPFVPKANHSISSNPTLCPDL